MDSGKLAEFDEPHLLLQDKTSLLYNYVLQTGSDKAQSLLDMAKQAFELRNQLCEDSNKDDICTGYQPSVASKEGVQRRVLGPTEDQMDHSKDGDAKVITADDLKATPYVNHAFEATSL